VLILVHSMPKKCYWYHLHDLPLFGSIHEADVVMSYEP